MEPEGEDARGEPLRAKGGSISQTGVLNLNMNSKMNPVVQQDRTGCGIASVAALTNQTYETVKKAAAELGVEVTDAKLWSDTTYVRRLLARFQVSAAKPKGFVSWRSLPDCALLAIKWHLEKTGPAWHWVVFVREEAGHCVLDPKKALRSRRRTDFGRMKPKWFIAVHGKGLADRPT